MKITHIILADYFADNHSYQENLLPKYHKLAGHDVTIIAGPENMNAEGHFYDMESPTTYINEYGIPVYRLSYRKPKKIYKRMKRFVGLKDKLHELHPDILFIHMLQFLDADVVTSYARERLDLTIYVDNHADFGNSGRNWLSRKILHGVIWKRTAHILEPYVRKFYGVLPARVNFLTDVYGLPQEKCELLVLGADNELIDKAAKKEVREEIRTKYGIPIRDTLIITGGKINRYRPETLNLMKAVIQLNRPDVKLLVFGNVAEDLQKEFNELIKNPCIVFIGWIQSKDTYPLFASSDLIVFPGLHSVMWEQAVAQGKPCVFKKLEGFDHVDLGGNALFLNSSSEEEIQTLISDLIDHPEAIVKMKQVAINKGMKTFSYSEIAKRSIMEV